MARMTADDFRAELAALANGLRRTIEADCAGFPADAKASAQRVRRVQGDFPFFRRTYFPHYTRRKDGTPTGDSALHLWLDTALPAAVDNPEGIRQACAAPRGEAKTTFVDVFFLLWCVVTGRKRYILLVADAFEQAASFLEAIKVELESNPRLMADFPGQCGEGRVWNVGTIITASNVKIQADSWRNNRGDKSGITRDEPGHTGKTLCNFIAWDENRRGGKSLPFSSLLDGVRVWPESLFRLSTHHGSGSVGGVLPHLGKPTVGPLAVVFFHR